MAGRENCIVVPVSAAAKRIGLSAARIYQMIEEGKLQSIKVDSTVLVYESSISWAVALRQKGVRNAA